MRILFALIAIVLATYACDCQRTPDVDPKAGTTDSIYNDNGKLQKVIRYQNDSLHYSVEEFHASGQITYTGTYGAIKNISVPLEEHLYYRTDGTIDKRITYVYENTDAENVKEVAQLQEELTFHLDGKTPKKSAMYRGCPGSNRSPCGEWLSFDENGNKMSAVIYDAECK